MEVKLMKNITLLLLSILLIFIVTGCDKPIFNGNRISNDKEFSMDYSILNKTETHEMILDEGTIVDVNIVNKSGYLNVLVKDTNEQELYRGDNALTSHFSITIPKTDTYIFNITGNNAEGSVSFKVAD
jgi:hypothetical protein